MDDLIRREDATKALIETEEIKGNAYVVLLRALEEIPAVKVDKLELRQGAKID